jgi:hypothetical protein
MDNQQERLESRLCWLGGIIDGEGCLTISSYFKRYNGTEIFAAVPIIQITNTNKRLVETVVNIYSEFAIRHYVSSFSPKAKNSKTRYDIAIKGIERCNDALKIIKPYIIIKDIQAEILQKFCRYRLTVPRNYPHNQKTIDWVTQLRELNSKGSSILNDYTPDSIKSHIEMI